jgi:monofunctional biosynthetic peptidoglycan transglycosylase
VRKGVEAYLTALIEALWPKRRIMEVYLNIVELGEGNFGVEAAARNYFGKPASRLSREEAARLAAVLPNPRGYRVLNPGPYVQRRTTQIANMMSDVTRDRLDGCITQPAP